MTLDLFIHVDVMEKVEKRYPFNVAPSQGTEQDFGDIPVCE